MADFPDDYSDLDQPEGYTIDDLRREFEQGSKRRVAARKGAATRAKKRAAERAKVFREVYAVWHGNEPVAYFDLDDPDYGTVEHVLGHLIHLFQKKGGRFEGKDMGVWNDGRLVGAVRKDEHGRPEMVTFEPTARQVVVSYRPVDDKPARKGPKGRPTR
jgi:hypothetical protein